jgi:hypothetical protein
MRATKVVRGVVLGAVMLVGTVFGASAALGVTAPMKGGVIQFWVTPSPTGNGGQVLITGVIGDYGKAQNVTAAGKPVSKKSSYKDLMLKKGTILINLRPYQKAQNNAKPAMYNKSTCSAYLIVSAPAPIVSGTPATNQNGRVQRECQSGERLPRGQRRRYSQVQLNGARSGARGNTKVRQVPQPGRAQRY